MEPYLSWLPFAAFGLLGVAWNVGILVLLFLILQELKRIRLSR